MKEWLQAVGIESERLQMERCSVGNEWYLSEVLKSFAAKLEGTGSTPLK